MYYSILRNASNALRALIQGKQILHWRSPKLVFARGGSKGGGGRGAAPSKNSGPLCGSWSLR